MTRIAKRRIIIVLAVSGVLAASAGGLYQWRQRKIAAHFQTLRAEGLAAAKAENYVVAVGDLQQYLVRYGSDVDALREYCRIRPKVPSADRSHLRETMGALRYLVSLRPDLVEERRELLKLYLTYNLNTEALDAADRLLASDPDNAELWSAKTTALARLRRTPEALLAAKKWVELAPDNTDAQRSRVELMKSSGVDDATILKDVDELVKAQPDSQGMRIVQAQALLQANRIDDAKAKLSEAAAMPAGSAADVKTLAQLMDAATMYDESIALLQRIVETASPADADDTTVFLARRLWQRGDAAGFLKLADQHPQAIASDPGLSAVHGIMLRQAGRTAEGDAVLAKLEANTTDPVAKAWSAIIRGASGPLTIDLAKQQITLLNDALIDHPGDANLLYFLGEAYAQSGDTELAVSVWRRASSLEPAWAMPLIRSSEVLASQNKLGEAFETAAAAAMRSQRLALPNYLKVWTATVETGQRTDGANLLNVLDDVLKRSPDLPWLHVLRATVLCQLNRTDEAKASIQADLANPNLKFDQESLLRLTALSRVRNLGLDQTLAERTQSQFGINAENALTQFFRVFLASGGDAALSAFEKIRASAPDHDARNWMLADARVRDFVHDPKAADAWRATLAAHPDDIQVLQASLASAALWQDRAVVDGLIEKLRALTGDRGLSWRLNRARWLVEGTNDSAPDRAATQKASDLLTEVLATSPNSVPARYWQARCQVRLGNRGAAVEQLLIATRLTPNNVPLTLYTAQLLQELGDFPRASQQLERLSTQDLSDPEQSMIAAQLLAQQNRPQEAIERLESTANFGQSEQRDLLRGMLYERQGEYEKAEAIITRLMQQPTLPGVTFAADFYRARGKGNLADRMLQKIDDMKLDPGVREMTLADHYLKAGDAAQGLKFAAAATEAAPQNPAAWKSLVLAQLQARNVDAASDALSRAVQKLPNDADLNELRVPATWALITRGIRDGGGIFMSVAARLASFPKDDAAREALSLFDRNNGQITDDLVTGISQLANRYQTSGQLQVTAAQLLLAAGRTDEAAAIAARGVSAFPTDVNLPRLAAQALLAGKEWSQAKLFAETWRKQAGGDVIAPDLLSAIAALELGQPGEAESLLRPHATFAMDRLEQHGDVIRVFATALYATGKSSEAQQIVEQAIGRRPEFAIEWLNVAGASLPTRDAVMWIHRLETQADQPAMQTLFARLWLQISMRPDAPAEAMPNVKAYLAKLEARTDLDSDMLATVGIIADQLGDTAAAERIYRRATADNATVPIVWNNLAMLLLNQHRNLEEAEGLATRATKAVPKMPVLHDTRAQALLALGNPEAARDAIAEAVRLEPANPLWALTSAEVAAASGGSPEQARAALDKLLATPNLNGYLGPVEKARLQRLQERLGQASATTPAPR